jgi:hypothetical protein
MNLAQAGFAGYTRLPLLLPHLRLSSDSIFTGIGYMYGYVVSTLYDSYWLLNIHRYTAMEVVCLI